jgi:hypothetical protein
MLVPQLPVDIKHVWFWAGFCRSNWTTGLGQREKQTLQYCVILLFRQWPCYSRRSGPGKVLGDARPGYVAAAGNLTIGEVLFEFESQ